MIERDWLMRQIRMLAQFLQQVLFQKQQGQVAEAHRTIRQAFGQVDDEERDNLRSLSLPETIRFCRRGGVFSPDLATHVADLLKEEGDLFEEQDDEIEARKSYARALLLYRRAMQENDAAVALDIHTTLSVLNAKLSANQIEAVERVLEDEASR